MTGDVHDEPAARALDEIAGQHRGADRADAKRRQRAGVAQQIAGAKVHRRTAVKHAAGEIVEGIAAAPERDIADDDAGIVHGVVAGGCQHGIEPAGDLRRRADGDGVGCAAVQPDARQRAGQDASADRDLEITAPARVDGVA
ncbi:hypothetical protein [Bradyrhizobium ottawaense]|uniref:hypothetical protein n=1 Tax=Bradyrhizobium ottawaense TaxID=931866 RepID=UPI0035137610